MARTGKDQGQWLDMQDWVKAEKLSPKYPGRYIIDFKRAIGRVYNLDGTITENVTRAVIERNRDGTLNFGYPVPNNFVLQTLKRNPNNE